MRGHGPLPAQVGLAHSHMCTCTHTSQTLPNARRARKTPKQQRADVVRTAHRPPFPWTRDLPGLGSHSGKCRLKPCPGAVYFSHKRDARPLARLLGRPWAPGRGADMQQKGKDTLPPWTLESPRCAGLSTALRSQREPGLWPTQLGCKRQVRLRAAAAGAQTPGVLRWLGVCLWLRS